MKSLIKKHGRQCMPCSAKFSMTLQSEILSTETSDFLKQIIFLKSFKSVCIFTNANQVYKIAVNDFEETRIYGNLPWFLSFFFLLK